ncbi:hypothetical protein F5146DRAFT_1027210, partial [Armillaria mellea]
MRFSAVTFLPLAALAVPALSASVQARDDSYGNVDHKGKDGGSKDYNYGNKDKDGGRGDCTWTPVFEHKNDFKGWNKGKYTPYEHKEVAKINFEIGNARTCARRTIDVTLARRTRMMRRMTSSFVNCLSRLSTSTPGRMTVMMARMTKTTRMA